MSSPGGEFTPVRRPAEWDQLELAVRRLMDEYQQWKRRALAAEARLREVEATLREVSSGALDPVALTERIEALEAENRDLRNRLGRARETIERILARLQFLEEER